MNSPDSITSVHHPIFARFYARAGAAAEKSGAAQHRDDLLADATGRVIEVGAGTGLNFAHYPTTVTEVVAIEPEPTLRQMAERAARAASVPIVVMKGGGRLAASGDRGLRRRRGFSRAVLCAESPRGVGRVVPSDPARGRAALLRARSI
jgi:hypothetical protein